MYVFKDFLKSPISSTSLPVENQFATFHKPSMSSVCFPILKSVKSQILRTCYFNLISANSAARC